LPLRKIFGEKFGDMRNFYFEILPICSAADLHGAAGTVENESLSVRRRYVGKLLAHQFRRYLGEFGGEGSAESAAAFLFG
jgi:hypothetical protein